MSSCSAPDKSQPPAGRISSRSATGSASTRKASSSTSWTAARWFRAAKEVLAPREMAVPAHVKRASGIAANFLCDNSTYLLGADEKGKPERSIQCFEACAKLHHAILDGVDSPAARAILAFLTIGSPKRHRPTRYWLTAGRISPETPTFCSTMKGRRAASCPLKMKRSERHGSSTTAALRPTLRWSSVS